MNNVGITATWSRACVLLWASLWMLVVPLFHVHPGVDHRHGGEAPAHGVGGHIVLSFDSDGGFNEDQQRVSSEEGVAKLFPVRPSSHSFTVPPPVRIVP